MNNTKQESPFDRWVTRLATLIIIVGFAINYLSNGQRPYSPIDMDESCWISCTYYYDLAFRQKNLESKDWRHLDCIDHPPLMKFALGAFLSTTTGFAVKDLELRDKWDSFDEIGVAFEYYRDQIPNHIFTTGRLLTTLFMVGSGLTLCSLVKRTMSPVSALVTAILFTASPLIRFLATYINADSLLIFLSLIAIALQIRWIRSILTDGRWILLSLALGFVNSLVFNTKISGLIMVPTAVLSIITAFLLDTAKCRNCTDTRIRMSKMAFAIVVMCSASVLSAIAINPSFYRQPLIFVSTMFAHRLKALEAQQAICPQELTFPSDSIRLGTFALMSTYVGVRPGSMNLVLFGGDLERKRDKESFEVRLFRDTVTIGVVFLFFAGLLQFGQVFRLCPMKAAVMGINIAALTLAAYYSYQLNVPRYLVMAVPFLLPIVGLGFSVMLRDVISLRNHFSWRIARIILAFALTLNSAALAVQWNSYEFLRWHPDWPEESKRTRRPIEEFDRELIQIHSRVQAESFRWLRSTPIS